jgi:serine/threonine-protein kinase HipA
VVESFFDNLLPDSSAVRKQLQNRLGTASSEPLDLLGKLGGDCLGALQLLPPDVPGAEPDQVEGEPVTDQQIAELLRRLPRFPMGAGGDSHIRLSLAGNHEKTALLRHEEQWLEPLGATPTTHIFKLPIGVTNEGYDLNLSVENEWLCHRLLREFGFPVAHAEMMAFEEQRCLVVTRFDRLLRPNGKGILRLPHEDFCQATGTPSAAKYESDGGPGIRRCMELLSGAQNPMQDKELLFKTLVLFWVLCAIDGHAKNFSLSILPLGRFRMAPLYDVLSAYPILGHGKGQLARQQATMAMAVWGKNRHYHWDKIAKRHWLKTATDCGILEAESLIETIALQTETVISKVAGELPKDFPPKVAEPVFEGVHKSCQRLK